MHQLKETLKNDKCILFFLLLYSFIALYFSTTCSPFYRFNYWSDINIYFTIGRGITHGLVPYLDLFDHKGPLLFFIYAVGAFISEDTFTGIYFIETISLFISLYSAFKISNLFLVKKTSLYSTFLFSICILLVIGAGGSAEEIILPFWCIGLYFILKHFLYPLNENNPYYAIIHGICIGCVFMIKFTLIIFWFIPLLAIVIDTLNNRKIIDTIKYVGYIILGIIIIFIPTIAYFHLKGALSNLWEGYILFNIIYGTSYPASLIWKYIILTAPMLYPLPILMLAIATISPIFFARRQFIKNKLFNLSLPIMYLSTVVILFKAAYFSYYIIVLSTFILLGIITVLKMYEKKPSIGWSRSLSILTICVTLTTLYIVKKRSINERKKESLPHSIVNKMNQYNNNFHLLNIDMDNGYYMMTQTLPRCKYFFHPNIIDEKYPNINIERIKYITGPNAPEYITRHRYAIFDTTKYQKDTLTPIILNYYNIDTVITNYENWPPEQAILYKRKDLK